jgi:hypothetical protein
MDLSGIETEVRKILDATASMVPQGTVERVVQGVIEGFTPLLLGAISNALKDSAVDGVVDPALRDRLTDSILRQPNGLRQSRGSGSFAADD